MIQEATAAADTRTLVQAQSDPGLLPALERFLAAPSEQRRPAFRELVSRMKLAAEGGDVDAVATAIRVALLPDLDFTSAQSLYRIFKQLPSVETKAKTSLRLAVLGGFTTHQLRDLIDLHLFAFGVHVDIYEADYDVFRQEILDPTSDLYKFRPDVIYLATHWRNLGHVPPLSASAEEVSQRLNAEYEDWATLWRTAHERLNCEILQNNFDRPSWSVLGNHELRSPGALSRFIGEVNRLLVERAPAFVTIHDADALGATAGRRTWGNERFYLHAKLPCSPEYLVEYARSVSSVLAAQRGLSKKCLVLDLDNTLWGGVIGDDGMDGIRIGQGDAEGEAFAAFQRYAKSLGSRGVILAVCSKNTEHITREPFQKHTEMVLRIEDVSCFVANWTDKAENLRSIAKSLNIGLDALVFVDDNPAERSIIRQLLPEVAVPEVSTDPIEFIDAIERHRYFQVATIGAEDYRRTEYYRANAQRAAVASSASDIEGFLKSLEMTSTIGPINQMTIERSTQLINKSNQFNLTTRRKTVADVSAAMNSQEWVTLTATLVDRFGDNGLISVVLAHCKEDTLDIDTWLMSCRVLKRGVERMILNQLVEEARSRGLKYVRGEYIPTPKNDLVREHYSGLGFELFSTEEEGQTIWRLEVHTFKPRKHHIQRV